MIFHKKLLTSHNNLCYSIIRNKQDTRQQSTCKSATRADTNHDNRTLTAHLDKCRTKHLDKRTLEASESFNSAKTHAVKITACNSLLRVSPADNV